VFRRVGCRAANEILAQLSLRDELDAGLIGF